MDPIFLVRMTQAAALEGAAAHVDQCAANIPGDIHNRSDDETDKRCEEAIRALGRDLSRMAKEAATRPIPNSEFEAVRVALMELGCSLRPEHVLNATLPS